MKKNFLKIFLFFIILFLTSNVFAQSYDVSDIITSPSGGSSTGGYYQGTELNGSTGPFAIGTRYNGTLTGIKFNLPVPSSLDSQCFYTNMTYTVTLNMATEDWRNRFGTVTVKPYTNYSSNWSNGHITFVSTKKIYFTFKIPSSYTTCNSFVVVNIPSNDLFTPFTGETNWKLSKVILSDTLSSDSGGSSTPTPNPDYSDITNNQNQNTDSIINNNNQNTENIIDNNNQNTEDLLNATDSVRNAIKDGLTNSCSNIWNSHNSINGYTSVNNIFTSDNNFKTSDYFRIDTDTLYWSLKYVCTNNVNGCQNNHRLLFYTSNKDFISAVSFTYDENGTTYHKTVSVPNNAKYVRVSYFATDTNLMLSPRTSVYCKYGDSSSKLDDLNNSINNSTSTITDNQNQNTNSIINNNNQNSQAQIENANCPVGPKTFEYDSKLNIPSSNLLTTGAETPSSNGAITPYISIKPNTQYKIKTTASGSWRYCWYKEKRVGSSISCNTFTTNATITSPSNSSYLRIDLYYYGALSLEGPVCNNWEQETQDLTTNAINETNAYLKDDSNPNISDSEFTNLFNSVGFNDPLSYLLQLPVQFINQLVSQSNTCQTISLGTLWGVSLSLPCINIGSIIGQQVWDIIDVLFSVGLLVVIFKNLYQTFANLMTMGGEKEAREKFSMPTPMEFLSLILGGDR